MMQITPNDSEFNILFLLTLILIISKLVVITFLTNKYLKKKKEKSRKELSFLLSLDLMIITLLLSRIFYTYFDFFLTHLDVQLFHEYPNVLYWKIAVFIYSVGFIHVLYTIDKRGLAFKLKGIPALILLSLTIIRLLYPITTSDDFNFVSFLEIIQLPFFIMIVGLFFYMGYKISGIRTVTFMIGIGILVYGLGTVIIGESILAPIRNEFGNQLHVFIFLTSTILKILGMIVIGIGVSRLYL